MNNIMAAYHDSAPKELIVLQRVADPEDGEHYRLKIGWDFTLYTSLERLCEIKALIERELDAAQARADEQRKTETAGDNA